MGVDNNTIPKMNFKEVHELTDLEHFKPEVIMTKNKAAAGLCSFVINIVMYYEIVVTVEPKRIALREANEQLDAANTQLAEVMAKVRATGTHHAWTKAPIDAPAPAAPPSPSRRWRSWKRSSPS